MAILNGSSGQKKSIEHFVVESIEIIFMQYYNNQDMLGDFEEG